jgi:DNA-binding transcriptional LysR family regulator
MTLELRHLRYVVAVAQTGSISAAARLLHMTQPSLSRQLAALERELGARVVATSRTGTSLTAAGRALADGAPAVLAAFDDLLTTAHTAGRVAPPVVRVGFPDNVGYAFVVAVVGSGADGPVVAARQLGRGAQLTALRRGDLDVALLWGPVDEPDLRTEVVADEPLVAVLPTHHRLAGRRDIKLGELAREKFLSVATPGRLDRGPWLRSAARDAGFTAEIADPVPGLAAVLAAVGSGDGVLLGPQSMAAMLPDALRAVPVARHRVELIAVTASRPLPATVRLVLGRVAAAASPSGDGVDDD